MPESDAHSVLRVLREREFFSSTELARVSGLGRLRFMAAIRALQRKRLIEIESSNSRRASHIRINRNYGTVVGVDIGASNLRVALADMSGKPLGKWSASTRDTSSPKTVVGQICTGVDHLLRECSVSRKSLLAVAAGAPGVTDSERGIVIAASYLRGWRNAPLADLLGSALQLPAAVENDVRVAAIGENWLGAARGLRDFAFLAIGTGIAAGIVVNGKLLHGPDWTAGEVGYMLVPGAPEHPVGKGMPGQLENMIGGEGVRQQVEGKRSMFPRAMKATEIYDAAGKGDAAARAILERSARMLAYAIYNISVVVNCPLCVLGGGVGTNRALLTATRRILAQYREPVRPKLAVSALGADAQIMGAIRLALDTADSRIRF